jgi:hypothetical protein
MEEMRLDFIDVVRAYFHAMARREMYVDVPREDHEERMCGKSGKAMYGTRDAAQNWEVEYTEMMEEAKFRQGEYSECIYYHEERNIRVVMHGDDFAASGRSGDIYRRRKVSETKMEVTCKERMVRGGEGAVRVLNRVIRQAI